jgi:hypothetical protein
VKQVGGGGRWEGGRRGEVSRREKISGREEGEETKNFGQGKMCFWFIPKMA